MCLSGRGDKDVQEVSEILPKWADRLDWRKFFFLRCYFFLFDTDTDFVSLL